MAEAARRAHRAEKIVAELHGLAQEKRLREVTQEIIAPLVERANVPRRLKDRALSCPPKGVHPDELGFPADEVSDVIAGFIEEGTITVNARGAYEFTSKVSDPSPKEAAHYAHDILDGWPEDDRDKIIRVLIDNGSDDGGDEEA